MKQNGRKRMCEGSEDEATISTVLMGKWWNIHTSLSSVSRNRESYGNENGK